MPTETLGLETSWSLWRVDPKIIFKGLPLLPRFRLISGQNLSAVSGLAIEISLRNKNKGGKTRCDES